VRAAGTSLPTVVDAAPGVVRRSSASQRYASAVRRCMFCAAAAFAFAGAPRLVLQVTRQPRRVVSSAHKITNQQWCVGERAVHNAQARTMWRCGDMVTAVLLPLQCRETTETVFARQRIPPATRRSPSQVRRVESSSAKSYVPSSMGGAALEQKRNQVAVR